MYDFNYAIESLGLYLSDSVQRGTFRVTTGAPEQRAKSWYTPANPGLGWYYDIAT